MSVEPLSPPSHSKLALIFPPAMHPGGPPLGLASLQAFLKSQDYKGSIQSFDLNMAHFNQALRWLADGRLKMSLRKMSHESTAREVLDVCRFFRGDEGLDAFLDLSTYNGKASLYRSFETVLGALFENFARRIVAGLPVPSLVRSYFNELLAPVRAYRPTLAGLSILYSQQLYFALAIAGYLKEDGAKIVAGGATLSVMPHPERLLSEPIMTRVGKEHHAVHSSRFLDYLIVGEGEIGLNALANYIEVSRHASGAGGKLGLDSESKPPGDLSRVEGLVYLEESRLRVNPPRMVNDLNELPLPDFDDFALSDYFSPLPVLSYLSARGCFWGRCAFCTHQKTYMAYREEEVEKTASRLGELKDRYGVRHFNLVDEMIHPHRFHHLARAILSSGLKIDYSAYAKPTRRFDASLLRTLYSSGARLILWGVESGSQRVLDIMQKGTRTVEMERVLHEAHEAGLWNFLFMMFGFPTETRQEWNETLTFLQRSKESVDALSKSRFILLAGSKVFQSPGDYSITNILSRAQEDPISVAYDYETALGLSRAEAQTLFDETAPKLMNYGRSPYFGQLRDHLLIYASFASSLQREGSIQVTEPT